MKNIMLMVSLLSLGVMQAENKCRTNILEKRRQVLSAAEEKDPTTSEESHMAQRLQTLNANLSTLQERFNKLKTQ